MAGGGRVSVAQAAISACRSLIGQGKVATGDWSLSAAEENALLGDPPNWERYGKWFLGRREGVNPETKDYYAYPYGKDGQVYRRALIAAKQRASQQGHASVFRAAGMLLAECDGDEARGVVTHARAVDLQEMRPAAGEPWPGEQRVQALPWGLITPADGRAPWIVNEASAQAISAQFNGRQIDLPIDYDHFGPPESPNPFVVPAPAAGWVKGIEIVAPADGATPDLAVHGVWLAVTWTPRARQALSDREFRYFSAEFFFDPESRVVTAIGGPGLGAGALTNYPAVEGMLPVAARHDDHADHGGNAAEEDSAARGAEGGPEMERLMKELGVSTPEEAMKAIADLKAKAGMAEKAGTETVALTTQLEQVTARVKTLEPLTEKVKQLETEKAEAQVAAFLAEAREQLGELDEKTAAFARKTAARDLTEAREWLAIQPRPATVAAPGTGRLPISAKAAASGVVRFTFDADPDGVAVVDKAVVMAREQQIPLARAIDLVEQGG